MSDQTHLDLGGYVFGRLTAAERTEFERHLESCAQCRDELRDLSALASLLSSEPLAAQDGLPADLRARTLAAVERAAEEERPVASRGASDPVSAVPDRRWWLRRGGAVAVAVAAAATGAFFVGQQYEARDRGPVELEALLAAPSNPAVTGDAKVVKTGIGRVIEFSSDALPILPKGEFYELWFVGPGDSLEQPNRISAGTFHPDEQGRSQVTFAAAVDPAKYPLLSVTAEPGDGDPRRSGAEVLRSDRP